MAKTHLQMRYDGPAVADHSMDVTALAPALLAVGELLKLANHKFNGDRASIKVLINANVEQHCFVLGFDVVQSYWSHIQDLVGDDRVHSTKEILEWVGLASSAAAAPFGLFKFLGWLKGRKVANTEMTVSDGRDVVQVSVEGDNNKVTVYRESYELAQTGTAIKQAKRVVEPLKSEGYDKLTFHGTANTAAQEIQKSEATDILSAKEPEEVEELIDGGQRITAWIKVYSPVFDMKADKWRFKFGEAHPYMDISDTNIAERAIERGGSSANDTYKVVLEIRQARTPEGNFKNKYKIIEVLEFHPATFSDQRDWIGGSGADPEDEDG